MTVSPQRDFCKRQTVRRLPAAPERRTHIALADLLRLSCRPGWWWSHIPSGEHRTEQTGALLQRMGLRPGMLDFLLISPAGAHHWLELKRGLAPLTDGQIEFTAELRRRRVPYYVARDYDAAVRQLKLWGVL
jgi:hypothetical protein